MSLSNMTTPLYGRPKLGEDGMAIDRGPQCAVSVACEDPDHRPTGDNHIRLAVV